MDEWITDPKTIEKSRKYYAHFDCRTDIVKTRKLVTDPVWVAHHGFYPFIHYKKTVLNTARRREKSKNIEIFVMRLISIGVFFNTIATY